jgi:hypothetical protein
MIPALIGAGASILGGLLGSKNKAATTTEKKEPWAPAQQYLIDNLAQNKKLQDHYAQNPFNGLQQQGYENLFGDQNNFRQNIAPGLMQFANQGMNSNYQRQRYNRPGQAGGYGLLAQPQAQQGQQTGLLAPFSVAQSNPYAVGNLNAQNPLYKDPAAQTNPAQTQQQIDDAERRRLEELARQYYNSENLNVGFGA